MPQYMYKYHHLALPGTTENLMSLTGELNLKEAFSGLVEYSLKVVSEGQS